jgi:predicted peptidase
MFHHILGRITIAAAICFIVVATSSSAAEPAPGKQVAQSVKVKTGEGETERELHYLLFLPKDYGTTNKARKWPVILFLHGSGERGDDLDLVKKHGPPKIVESKPDSPFITVSPQCPSGSRWQPAELMQLIEHVSKTLAVDPTRIYVTGLSMGGSGTWSLAAAYPDKFAAIAPICGRGDPATAEKIKHLPTWVFHGAKDSAVSLEQSEKMVEALKKAGGEPKYTLYPDAGHDSWTVTYDNPDFYEWLGAQRMTNDQGKK